MFHFLIFLSLSALIQAHAHPIDWLFKFSSSARDENGWMWGWAWASDGSVSIVDRSPAVNFPARPASFGAELTDPLLGYAIPLSAFTAPCPQNHTNHTYPHSPFVPNPVQGCPHLCINGTRSPDPSESWIAIVQRGGCPFVEKARQAQQLGARAIVVGGDQDNPDALLNMYSERDASDVTIAATYIKYWDYVQLLQFIEKSNTSHSGLQTLSLLLQTEYAAWEWYSPIVTFVIILLLPSLLTFVTLLIHRVRAARAAQRDRAPEEVVHRLPWRVWTGNGWEKHEPEYPMEVPLFSGTDLEQGVTELDAVGDNHPSTSHEPEPELPSWVDEQQECAICLENFAKGDRVRVLPCHHMFHLDEVDEWLINKKKLCPVCKADVTQPHHDPAIHPHQLGPNTVTTALDEVSAQDLIPTSAAATILATERTPLLEDSQEERTATS